MKNNDQHTNSLMKELMSRRDLYTILICLNFDIKEDAEKAKDEFSKYGFDTSLEKSSDPNPWRCFAFGMASPQEANTLIGNMSDSFEGDWKALIGVKVTDPDFSETPIYH